jgi:Domain of unknown function (DUF4158)
MSIQFLSEEQQQGYGRYAGEPTSLQLARYFHLDDTALKIVKQRRGDHNRLGFAVQLCTVRFLGTFLINPIDVPLSVVAYLALQLDISSPDCLPRYLARPTTHWEHAQLIKQLYGYQDFSSQPYQWRLQRWLYERAWVSDESPSVLFDLTTQRPSFSRGVKPPSNDSCFWNQKTQCHKNSPKPSKVFNQDGFNGSSASD